jgi:hypothetical protein
MACGGVLFVAGSLGLACLDYAGEDYGAGVCPADDGQADAGSATPGSGSGSGAVEAEPDCEEVVAPPSDGSGSGSGAMQ